MSSYYDIMNGIKWTHPLADVIEGPSSITRLAESMDSWRRMSEIATSSLQLPGEGVRSIIAQEQEWFKMLDIPKLIDQEQSIVDSIKGVLPLDTPITRVSEQMSALCESFSFYKEWNAVLQNPLNSLLSGYEQTITNQYEKILSGINVESRLALIDATAGFVDRQAEWMGSLLDTISDDVYTFEEADTDDTDQYVDIEDVDYSATIAKIPQHIGYASRKDSRITHEEALEKSSLVEVTEKGKQIVDRVIKINEMCSMTDKEVLFKPTQKSISVGLCLGTATCSSEDEFKNVCDSLYFLFYENLERIKNLVTDSAIRAEDIYACIFDVKNFRSHYRHDLEHGKEQGIKKKQISIGDSFKKYCGKIPSASKDFMKLQIGLYDRILEMEDVLIAKVEEA